MGFIFNHMKYRPDTFITPVPGDPFLLDMVMNGASSDCQINLSTVIIVLVGDGVKL